MDEKKNEKCNPNEFEEYQLPWMPIFINDMMGSGFVSMLSDVEFRSYIKLLMYQWQYGAIPDDNTRLSRFLGKDKRTTKNVMDILCTKFNLKVQNMPPYMATQNMNFMYNEKLHVERKKRIKEHKSKVENAKRDKKPRATAPPIAPPMAVATQNSELRTQSESLKSSVDSVTQYDPPSARKTTEPNNKAKKTKYSNQTCWAISKAVNDNKAVFEGVVTHNSPAMQKLFMALLRVPGIDPENQRLLAYIIQGKEAPKPKNLQERLGYTINLLKAPRFPVADSAMQTAKDIIGEWSGNTGAKRQVAEIIENSNMGGE